MNGFSRDTQEEIAEILTKDSIEVYLKACQAGGICRFLECAEAPHMDQQIFFLINRTWAYPALDKLMATLSCWDLWWPVLIAAVIWIWLAGGFRARAMLVAAVVAVGVTDGLVVNFLKHAVGRPRPKEVVEGARSLDLARARPRLLALAKPLQVRWTPPGKNPERGNSFPSGHTANNIAVAMVVFLFYRRWGWIAFFPAAMVSYSRMYVGAHWPTDVAASCVMGAMLAILVVRGLAWLWRRFGSRLMPQIHLNHPELLAP